MRFVAVVLLCGCADYDFVRDRELNVESIRFTHAVDLRENDSLLVIDTGLAYDATELTQSILYSRIVPGVRLGIVSTDLRDVPCDSCADIVIAPNQDGRRGRLVAAYDAERYSLNAHPELVDARAQAAFLEVAPKSIGDVSPVIDFTTLFDATCEACGCSVCRADFADESASCFGACVRPVTRSLLHTDFATRIAALGANDTDLRSAAEAVTLAVAVNNQHGFTRRPDASLIVGIVGEEDACATLEQANVRCNLLGSAPFAAGDWRPAIFLPASPVDGVPDNISVRFTSRADLAAGRSPRSLPLVEDDGSQLGWSYEAWGSVPGLRLHGLDLIPGDTYEIEVLTRSAPTLISP